jgi:hypothetical protein
MPMLAYAMLGYAHAPCRPCAASIWRSMILSDDDDKIVDISASRQAPSRFRSNADRSVALKIGGEL